MSIISEFHKLYEKETGNKWEPGSPLLWDEEETDDEREPDSPFLWNVTETTQTYPCDLKNNLKKISDEMEEQNRLTRMIENRKLGRSILY